MTCPTKREAGLGASEGNGGMLPVANVLDRAYLAMDAALQALREGCDCGCTDEARDGLVDAMRDLEGMTEVPQRTDCCGDPGDCECK